MESIEEVTGIDLVLIVAVSQNGVIGKNGIIPWTIRDDLTRFKELTLGHPVIMGRKTYESIPLQFRPLPGRYNIVITHDKYLHDKGIYVAHSLEEAIDEAKKHSKVGENPPLAYVIGGGTIYQATMQLAKRLEITLVDVIIANGDAFFPVINRHEWQGVPVEYGKTIFDENGIPIKKDHSFVTYTRIKK